MRIRVLLASILSTWPAWGQVDRIALCVENVPARSFAGGHRRAQGSPERAADPGGLPESQQVLGWDDSAWSRLRAIAEECAVRAQALDAAARSIALYLRIALAAGQDTSRLRPRLDAIEQQRRLWVEQQLQQLRREPKFTDLDAFVSGRAGRPPFFPSKAGVPASLKGRAR